LLSFGALHSRASDADCLTLRFSDAHGFIERE
jgi:hypothetical protein